MRRLPAHLKNVFLSLTVTALLLLGLEGGARLWERRSPPPPFASSKGGESRSTRFDALAPGRLVFHLHS